MASYSFDKLPPSLMLRRTSRTGLRLGRQIQICKLPVVFTSGAVVGPCGVGFGGKTAEIVTSAVTVYAGAPLSLPLVPVHTLVSRRAFFVETAIAAVLLFRAQS